MKCIVCGKNLAGPLKVGGQPSCPGCGWTLPVMVTQKVAVDTSGLSKAELKAALALIDADEDHAEELEETLSREPRKVAKRGRGRK